MNAECRRMNRKYVWVARIRGKPWAGYGGCIIPQGIVPQGDITELSPQQHANSAYVFPKYTPYDLPSKSRSVQVSGRCERSVLRLRSSQPPLLTPLTSSRCFCGGAKIIFVGLLLCKVDPQIWTGCFLIYSKSGKKPEYSYSLSTVYLHWIDTLTICGFGDATYRGGLFLILVLVSKYTRLYNLKIVGYTSFVV